MQRKVPTNLLDELIRLSENQVIRPLSRSPKVVSSDNTGNILPVPPEPKKVPEGSYKVEVISIACSSKTAYKVVFKILSNKYPEEPIISGYCRRYQADCSDLNSWFGDGEKITSTTQCKGKFGTVYYSPTSYNWFSLFPKEMV